MNSPAPSSLTLSPGRRLTVLAPHPDDESLAAGGLIQHAVAAGADVRVVFATDGDNNPWPQRWVERRWFIDADCRRRWGALRRAEGKKAIKVLGLTDENAVFFGFPDTELLPRWRRQDADTLQAFVNEFTASPPDILITPSSQDAHPDHLGMFHLAQEALNRAGLTPAQFTYLIHRRWFHPHATGESIKLTAEEQATKLAAILCHETQIKLSRGRFSSYASPEEIFTPELSPAS
jgi:LmbE family N-acetylglucosaminyl deacetylase